MTTTSETATVASRSRGALGFGIACVVYLALAFAVLGAAWRAPDRLLPYFPLLEEPGQQRMAMLDHHDQRMVVTTVTANAAAIVSRPWALPAAAQCFPTPHAHTLGEHMLGLSLLAALPWALTHDPILSFNVALLLTLWIAGVAMYRLAWSFTGSFAAALVAGLLFELGPRRLADPTHPYIHGDLWTPLALLCLHRTLARDRWRDAAGFALFTVLALLESLYSVLGYAVLLAVYAPYALFRHRARLATVLPKLAASALVVLAVAWWLFGPYLASRGAWQVLGGRPLMLYGIGHYLPGRVAFPGFLLLALAAIGAIERAWRARVVEDEDPRLAYLTGGLLLLALTIGHWPIPFTGTEIRSPLMLLRILLPGLDAVRALPAIGIVAGLPLAFVAGYGVLAIVDRLPRLAGAAVTAAIVVLALASTFHPAIVGPSHGVRTLASAAWSARPPDDEIALVRRTSDGAVLDFPFYFKGVFLLASSVDLLRASYGPRQSAACYNSFRTPVQEQVADLAAALPAPEATEALHALGFRTVLVEHEPFLRDAIARFERALRQQPPDGRTLVQSGRVARVSAYQIVARAPVAQSFASLAPGDDPDTADLTVPRGGGEVALAVRNDGAATFRHPDPLLPSDLTLSWTDASGRTVLEQDARALLPIAIGPHASGTVRIAVVPPPPGRYELRVARAADPGRVLLARRVTVTADGPPLASAPPPAPSPRAGAARDADLPDRRRLHDNERMVVLVMGVAGAGKTTIGSLLARTLGWEFYDADDFHPDANVAKIARGEPLSEDDRDGWLTSLAALVDRLVRERRDAVLACSALRASHRARLRGTHGDAVRVVYLRGDPALLAGRLRARRGHFAGENLLGSQLATLEEPRDALVVDVADTPETIVQRIRTGLALGR